MDIGTIFLIQPAELVGTNRYKIGFIHDKNTKEYINNYLDGTRFIIMLECNNLQNIINEKKNILKQKFKLVACDEYYEGKECEIKQFIIAIIDKYLNINSDHIIENDNIDENDDIDENDNININDNIDENKIVNKSLHIFIKNNLQKKKYEFVTIKTIINTYYKNDEYLKLKKNEYNSKKKVYC